MTLRNGLQAGRADDPRYGESLSKVLAMAQLPLYPTPFHRITCLGSCPLCKAKRGQDYQARRGGFCVVDVQRIAMTALGRLRDKAAKRAERAL